MSRRGLGLVEVLLALALAAVLGGAALEALRAGATGARVAGDREVAAALAARWVDDRLAAGAARLAEEARTSDASARMVETREAEGGAPLTLTGESHLDEAGPGLLRLRVTVRWDGAPGLRSAAARELTVTRLLADPDVAPSDDPLVP